MDTLLQVTGLTKNHAQFRALRGVNLSVGAGEIVGLVGENGAGKSTLISVLSGLIRPDEGTLTLRGEPFAPLSPQQARAAGVSAVHQRFTLDSSRTVLETIAGSEQGTAPREERLQRARAALEASGAALAPDAKISSLLRAEKALVEVLRVQVEDPALVLMDEVAATFNDHEVATVHKITRQLAREGRGIIYITHRIDEVRSLADRILVLREGVLKDEFVPREADTDQIVYSMLERSLPQRERPDDTERSDEALVVRGLRTPSGLSGIDLRVHRGEVLGLTGLRRAGMNDVVSALVGVHPGEYDELRVGGREATITSPQDAMALGIGYLSDNDDELGIAQEETLARTLLREQDGADADFVGEVTALREVAAQVKALRIKTHSIQGRVGALSGGDQQKIALARWMSTDCDILILNHPTRGIDIGAKGEIYEMLTTLTDQGTSVILLSSELSELLQWCHRILVMRDGAVVSEQINSEATEDTLMRAAGGLELPRKVGRRSRLSG